MLMHRLSLTAICLLTLGAAACGTTIDPDLAPELDTDAALEDYATLEAIFASQEFTGFQALGGRTPFGASIAGADVIATLPAASRQDGGQAFKRELTEMLSHRQSFGSTGPAAAPIISGFTRGKTFVYDPEVDDYRHAPDRTGAPENGVRFIMYAVDSTGMPDVSSETGYADVLDEGDESVEDIVLRLMVVQTDETVLDYRTSLDITETGGALTVEGFLVGDGNRLDFDIGATARTQTEGGELLDVVFDLTVDSHDFRIQGEVTGIDESDDDVGEVDITVTHGPDSIRLDVAGIAGELAGTVYLNGSVFATVSGPESDPVFQDASGQPLTLREIIVLRHIFDAFGDVFGFLEDLLDPVEGLIALGIVL